MRKIPLILAGAAAVLVWPGLGFAGSITPDSFSATIAVGETIAVDKTVTLDDTGPAVSKVDVFFLSDNTGSMGGTISIVKDNASTILGAIAGADPRFAGIDVGFGVGRYLGDPSEPSEDEFTAYQLQQAITTVQADAQSAIDGWFASGGGDTPEANFFALHQVATEGAATDGGLSTGQVTGWRDGAGRVIVWFGDAESHTVTVDQAEAIAALTGANVTVAAINSLPADLGIDTDGQATAIAAATGGTLTNEVSGTDATIDAILAAVEAATSMIDLIFQALGDTSGLDISYTCTDALGCTDVGPGESRDFMMSVMGLSTGTFAYETVAVGVAGAVEADAITVTDDGGRIPAPGSLVLLATGLIMLGGLVHRRRRP